MALDWGRRGLVGQVSKTDIARIRCQANRLDRNRAKGTGNMMKFFYSPGSCALATHIVLAEVGADYEARRISFPADEQRSPEFLAINPKGRVPALVTERGILTETPAILVYLAQAYPDSQMMPVGDPFEFALAQSFNSYLCSTVHVAHAHGGRGARWADNESSFADMKQKVSQTMAECFELIEREYIKGPWVLGDQFSACDAYLYTVSRWLKGDGVERSRFPKVDAQAEALEQRPRAGAAIEVHFGNS
jgi:glutathione S-transferase